jgi:hypothetical protein
VSPILKAFLPEASVLSIYRMLLIIPLITPSAGGQYNYGCIAKRFGKTCKNLGTDTLYMAKSVGI